jgi:hypothetical protein
MFCRGFVIPRKNVPNFFLFTINFFFLLFRIALLAATDSLREGVSLNICNKLKHKMAFADDHGTRIFDQLLASGGLAHIAENIFDHLDVENFANCQLVCKSWQHFIVNITNRQLWKRKYLQKLAKPGSRAHGPIKSNLNLFQFNQGIHISILHYYIIDPNLGPRDLGPKLKRQFDVAN